MKGEEVIESDEEEQQEVKALPVPKKQKVEQVKGKGDADSSSDEDNEADPETVIAARKAQNAKLKRDLEKEQTEMAKVLMTNRQRKLYQKAEDEQKLKKEMVQKLKVKKRQISKK